MDFQADALRSPSDWSDFNVPRFDWLRVPPSAHQLENRAHYREKHIPVFFIQKKVPEIEPELKNGKEVIPGVIYISSIPRGMGPIHVRQFMQIFGELGRIYLAPRDKKAIKKNTHRYAVDDYSGRL